MAGFRICGGEKIEGTLMVDTAKNAVLPMLAACVLAEGDTVLTACPALGDVACMRGILERLGCASCWKAGGALRVQGGSIRHGEMPEDMSKRIRSSVFLLGPLLGRLRQATIAYPGGCEIGLRPIDLHLSALKRMGVRIADEGGLLRCDGRNMHAADIHLDYPSVGATENIMMAAALLPGRTTISNAAREPEIVDLQGFINAMGGSVQGAGSQLIVIDGVKQMHGAAYQPMPDRIAAGTYLCAAAMTGGSVQLTNARAHDLTAVLDKLRAMGCEIREEKTALYLSAPKRLQSFDTLQTQPYPGFPTDMQSQMLALACVSRGASVIEEKVFENRFAIAGDLCRMGANIRVSGRAALIQGVEALHGAHVAAHDLRGGAALVLAGLAAQGETLVEDVHLIDRGYECMENRLKQLGARMERVETQCAI